MHKFGVCVERLALAIKYPAYGHALWEPNPGELYSAVEVGDVGFIREGKFHRLFNALLSAEHPSHQRFGVPEYHEPLRPNVLEHVDSGILSPNDFHSAGVTVDAGGLDFFASEPEGSAQVSFSCNRKRGAVLSLPVQAQRKDTIARGAFGQWIVKHIDRWFAFTKRLGLGIDQMEDIILVTGCHRTRSWTNVAFLESQADAQVSFGVEVAGNLGSRITWQFSRKQTQGAVLNRGPGGTNLAEDQCIFVRGFRVTRLLKILPRQLRGAAEHAPDPGGYDCEPDTELISIPPVTKYRDPLHLLLDYITERAPDCDMVLVHDDDLERIEGIGDGTSLETLQSNTVMDYFQMSNAEIHKVSWDLSLGNNSPNAGTQIVTVAMLSIFQELNPTLQSPLLFPTSENTSSHYTSNFPVVVPQTSQDGQDDPLMSHTRSGMSEHCALKRGERQSPSAFSLPVGRTHLENVPTGPAANNTNTLEGPHIKGFFDGLQRTLSATPGTIQISLSNFSLSPDKFAQVKRHKFTSAVLVACTLVSFLVWMRTFNWDVISMLFFTLVSGSFALSVWFHRERTHHLLDEMHEKMEALQHSVKSLELSIPRELVVPDVVQGGFPVLAREVPTRREMLEQSVQTSEQTATFRPDGHCGPQGHRDNTMGLLDVGITGSAAEQQCSPSVPVQGPSLRHLPIPEGHPEVSSMLSNFADGLHFIFSRTGDAEHLEGSMALYRSAVEYPFSSARDRLIPAKNWTITARSTRHSSALTAYRKALFLLQRAIDLGPTVQTRHEYISGRDIEPLRSLPMDAASYAIESRAYEEAIEMLEQGRTLLWSGMRSLRTPLENLHQVDNSLADEFTEISQALEAIITTTDVRDFVQTPAGTDDDGVVIGRKDTFAHDLAEKRRLSGELDKVVLRIQALPGFENFWRPIPFRHLQTAAMGGPVVIINLSEYRSDILIIRSNHPVVHIPTPTNFFDRVKKLAHRLSETRKSYRLESKTYNRTLRRTLEELSELVGRPVADRLMELGIPEQSRIWLCPTSVLASLPIHAAGPISSHTNVKRYLCDIYVCSYTPSLSALIASGPRNLSGSASGQPPSLLIVGHPDQALPGVDSEIRSIECLVGNDSVTKITGEAATPENVIARLPMHPWVHFACHGVLQPGRPFESSFLLQYNTHLTLLRIAKSHLPTAELAFLAACHTAELTEDSTPDEVLHLTAAMQFSGFRSVIGTLWAMADEDGQDLSEHFYRKMMFAAGAQVASYEKSARALRYATQKLRTKKGISLERWVNFVHYGA